MSDQLSNEPSAGSNAARSRQDRRNLAARENAHDRQSAQEDPREMGAQPSNEPSAGSNAAWSRQDRRNPAARENKQ
jgi:hypothetical protein